LPLPLFPVWIQLLEVVAVHPHALLTLTLKLLLTPAAASNNALEGENP
jgi:hypothetical protein